MRLSTLRFLAALAVVCLFITARGTTQEAVTAHHRTLDELVDESAFIVHGRVTAVRVESHPELKNLNTLVVTMQVDDVLKGDLPHSFTFRQFVWDIRSSNTSEYRKRQELLLFLRPPSRYGLTSPAGLSQGRFSVRTDASGATTAVNGDNNAGLFATLRTAAKKSGAILPASASTLEQQKGGPVALQDLKAVVRSLAARSK